MRVWVTTENSHSFPFELYYGKREVRVTHCHLRLFVYTQPLLVLYGADRLNAQELYEVNL